MYETNKIYIAQFLIGLTLLPLSLITLRLLSPWLISEPNTFLVAFGVFTLVIGFLIFVASILIMVDAIVNIWTNTPPKAK